MARQEMAGDAKAVDRELVLAKVKGAYRVINEPMSVRAMNQALKGAYMKARRAGMRAAQDA